MSYLAPIKDINFVLKHLSALNILTEFPAFEEASLEIAEAILEENARLVQDVIAPLNREGDLNPPSWKEGEVCATAGFKEAFQEFAQGGWQGLQHPIEFGGQGLPKTIATPCIENLNAANLSFALCPLLTDGAIEALLTAGSQVLKDKYVPKLVDGTWTGTMNLTEPQAGSDLALVRSRAEPQGDGTYRIFGQKIFITYGEHDMVENIVHLVLARTPGAPEGVKGISLFVVPKFLVNDDGSLGERNDVWCASIEHKLGIKASPTAVLIFGDDKGRVGAGAIGYLVGEENRGLEYMFVMMNAARFAVGVQGIAVSERAYQHAVSYARERKQSRAVEGSPEAVAIIHHPDVRRMLMTMRALTEGARAVAYVAAGLYDIAHAHPDEATRKAHQARYEYMVPIVKAFSTEMSIEVTSLGVQVHGGMGFIEETGAAQHYRDARILPIYEGTTAIQANDFIGRKTARDGGALSRTLIDEMRLILAQLEVSQHTDLVAIAKQFKLAINDYEIAVEHIVQNFKGDIRAAFAGSVPYLMLAGYVHSAWQLARAAMAAQQCIDAGSSDSFYTMKIMTARFFAENILPRTHALQIAVCQGTSTLLALNADDL